MSEYKRIISYLYKYERGNKGENAGYVRIDVRKGELKLLVHTQDSRALKDTEFQVYFYYHDGSKLKGVHGGSLRFHQGESEFRRETKESSIFNSGHSLDEMGGLLLYYNKELAYGTEWDDHPIVLNQFLDEKIESNQPTKPLEEEIKRNQPTRPLEQELKQSQRTQPLEEDVERNRPIQPLERNIERERPIQPEPQLEGSVQRKIDEIRPKEEQRNEEKEAPKKEQDRLEEIGLGTIINTPDSMEQNKKNDWMPFYQPEYMESEKSEIESTHRMEEEEKNEEKPEIKGEEVEVKVQEEILPEEDHIGNLQTTFLDLAGLSIDQETLLGLQAIYQGSSLGKELFNQNKKVSKEDIEDVERTQQEKIEKEELYELMSYGREGEEEEKKTSEQLFLDLVESSPKMSHPMNHEIRNLVRIHPQDIGKLAISNWHFGSNSFVIHGYYQFHYIVIGTILLEDGQEQPMIGVPGIYTNQDKYMALQFGFKRFIPIKPAQIKTGSFGYWITNLTE